MTAKLIMTWDIVPEREREYFEFVIREFLPGVQKLGLELTDAWATVYGEQPQIQVGAVSDTLGEVNKVLTSAEWDELKDKLMEYVINYHQKVVNLRKGFQF
ncbi:MAG: hypothetical protein HPY85_17000 [Anaerolineae bacterium]|jgi:hypothetical protein|nr:hypothetical protein [Anaerolineae bacterium]